MYVYVMSVCCRKLPKVEINKIITSVNICDYALILTTIYDCVRALQTQQINCVLFFAFKERVTVNKVQHITRSQNSN